MTNLLTAREMCTDELQQPFPFSMAFQPIVDIRTGAVYAYEALVRGPRGESAGSVLAQVTEENRGAFDQGCRSAAILLAGKLGLAASGALLSINFMPGAATSSAACLRMTLEMAETAGIPLDQLIFEVTETEEVHNRQELGEMVAEYRRRGFRMALDDFGAGYSGFNMLADLPLDVLKLDMDLTRNLANRPAALTIVKSMVALSRTMGIDLVAEGVETVEEYEALEACGIRLMQGYLFARPGFERLPAVRWPEMREMRQGRLRLSVA